MPPQLAFPAREDGDSTTELIAEHERQREQLKARVSARMKQMNVRLKQLADEARLLELEETKLRALLQELGSGSASPIRETSYGFGASTPSDPFGGPAVETDPTMPRVSGPLPQPERTSSRKPLLTPTAEVLPAPDSRPMGGDTTPVVESLPPSTLPMTGPGPGVEDETKKRLDALEQKLERLLKLVEGKEVSLAPPSTN